MIKKILLLGVLIFTLALNAKMVFAEPAPLPPPSTGGAKTLPSAGDAVTAPQTVERLENPIQSNDLKALLASLVDLAIVLGTIVAVFMFIWIGFQFVTAQGDEGKIKDAKAWFVYAVVGTAILIGSKVILEVIKSTLIDAGLVQKGLF